MKFGSGFEVNALCWSHVFPFSRTSSLRVRLELMRAALWGCFCWQDADIFIYITSHERFGFDSFQQHVEIRCQEPYMFAYDSRLRV